MDELTFYVSPTGNDADLGTIDRPFATLHGARNAVRAWREGSKLDRPVQVLARGGRYFLPQPLILGPEDSGSPEFPVTFAAYPGETPILSGGRVVGGWQPYQGPILKASLPEARGGKWKFRQLFYCPDPCGLGMRQMRARYPKLDPANPLYSGWANLEGPADDGPDRSWNFPEGIGWHMKAERRVASRMSFARSRASSRAAGPDPPRRKYASSTALAGGMRSCRCRRWMRRRGW
jgi:hypothetical protein